MAAKKKAAKKKAGTKKTATKTAAKKPTTAKPKAASAKRVKAPLAVAKKPKRPARANKPPPVPYQKTLDMTEKAPPPKPKATISRPKAVELANTFLKENVGKADLWAPRTSRFRLGNIIDRGGTITIYFCHEADDDAPLVTLGAKCLVALVTAHPQLRAFEIEAQTIRM